MKTKAKAKVSAKIETMYELKKVLNKISDADLKRLGFGFDGEDGSPGLLCWGGAGTDECEDYAMTQKVFSKKSVELLSKYFTKIVDAVTIFEEDEGFTDYYLECIGTETKLDEHLN